jgi:hypothetical protein
MFRIICPIMEADMDRRAAELPSNLIGLSSMAGS